MQEVSGTMMQAGQAPPAQSETWTEADGYLPALTTSFKLDWSDQTQSFVLGKTGEALPQLMGRILTQQLGSPVTV